VTLSFVETTWFTENCLEYFGDDEGYRQFQEALLRDPEAGRVIPKCGGFRKLRWCDPRRGKGTRGGIRVIYLYLSDVLVVLLTDAYNKNEASDLTEAQKIELSRLADTLREELRRASNG
jgi:mRNA-degrading endonuclease RelE of RelBE toxin-antitoxin system